VLARIAANTRLRDALYLQAFTALNTSPGARAYYDAHCARGHTHHQGLRALANRLVGILHGCLRHHRAYDEATAWPPACCVLRYSGGLCAVLTLPIVTSTLTNATGR
jgi:hypothetical protein